MHAGSDVVEVLLIAANSGGQLDLLTKELTRLLRETGDE